MIPLNHEECLLKKIHHHYFFFLSKTLHIWIYSLPFIIILYLFRDQLPLAYLFYAEVALFSIFSLIWLYEMLIFYLDSIIITNKRLIHLDWKSLFYREMTQVMLEDVQNIATNENGILASWSLFDFGTLKIETSSTKSIIVFNQAPDPEGLRFLIYNIIKKHAPSSLFCRDHTAQ